MMAEILDVISDPNPQLKQNEPKPPNNQEIPRPPENNDHGFRFLFKGNPIRRLVWFVITTTIFSFCFIMFYGLFSDFLLRKTTTATDKRIQEKDIPFPTVIICPINSQSKTQLNNLPPNVYTKKEFVDVARRTILIIKTTFNDTEEEQFYEYLENTQVETFTDFLKLYQLTYKNISDTKTIKSLLGEKSPCMFYGGTCTEEELVDDKIWDDMDMTTLCMQFNHYKPGLEPYLIKKAKSYFDGFNIFFDLGETFYFKSDFKRGLVMTLDRYGDDNSLMSSNKFIFLKPGEVTTLKMTEPEIIRLPAPFDTKCASVELPMIDPSRRYTKGLCVMNCVLKKLYEQCGCIAEHYKRLFQHRFKAEKTYPVVTWISLIANVGGAVGLGLGFSFITCFEFVFFFYDFIKLKIQKRRNRSKTVPAWALV